MKTDHYPRNGALAIGLSMLTGDWIDVEIVDTPVILKDPKRIIVRVWAPSMEMKYAYTNADIRLLSPKTPVAREILRMKPRQVKHEPA